MAFSDRLQKFNKTGFVPEGWFWLLKSSDLKVGKARAAQFAGRELAVFRGADGRVRALDAHCPHMGAHLGDGIVSGNQLKCLFHNWKFDESGTCVEIPCQKMFAVAPTVRTHLVAEKYGLVWLWTGEEEAAASLPEIPELQGLETESAFGNTFVKACHPNVVMINAIDANHFNTVHNLVVDLSMQKQVFDQHAVRFHNTTHVPRETWLTRLIGSFYSGALTYDMTYWYGHTGSVTLGPDFLHFYIIFALRPLPDGKTEGQTILVTKKRIGFFGGLLNRVLLSLTAVVGNYFAKGDTVIFSKIKFEFRHPTPRDQAIVEFIQHYEKQTPSRLFSVSNAEDRKAVLPAYEKRFETTADI